MEYRKFDIASEEAACYIFGAGEFYGLARKPRPGKDYVIAADGGLSYLLSAGIKADLLIGDLDSLFPEKTEMTERNASAAETGKLPFSEGGRGPKAVRRLSETKDMSDSSAALSAGMRLGYRRFYLYGCTGGRLDHTIATLQDMAALSEQGAEVYLFSEQEIVTALTDGGISFPEGMHGRVSVFSHSAESSGVMESGLKYTVWDHSLRNTVPLGLSNAFTRIPAIISVKRGTLLIFVENQC